MTIISISLDGLEKLNDELRGVPDYKDKVDDEGADKVLQEFMEKYEVYDLIEKYVTEENIITLVNLNLNEEQKEEKYI